MLLRSDQLRPVDQQIKELTAEIVGLELRLSAQLKKKQAKIERMRKRIKRLEVENKSLAFEKESLEWGLRMAVNELECYRYRRYQEY